MCYATDHCIRSRNAIYTTQGYTPKTQRYNSQYLSAYAVNKEKKRNRLTLNVQVRQLLNRLRQRIINGETADCLVVVRLLGDERQLRHGSQQ